VATKDPSVKHLEEYALIGDAHSAGLVSSDGSIDWLCLPRFDSGSVFGALLDAEAGGSWRICPAGDFSSSRAYRDSSMVLETTFETSSGRALLVDCLPLEESSDPNIPREVRPGDLVARMVIGVSGHVDMTMRYAPRFDYGYVLPFFKVDGEVVTAVGGPDALDLNADVPLTVADASVEAEFRISEGEQTSFIARYRPSHEESLPAVLPSSCSTYVEQTDRFWRDWSGRSTYEGPWSTQMQRSLLTLKALTYSPTGGIVAAATTSLPEALGGVRNWDYRYCWLRDATFSLELLLNCGYKAEAVEWRDWLLRAVAGDPEDLQIMYGVRGERRLLEYELPWLSGYEGASPVRVGNAATEQFQLDVYGEVMDAFHSARHAGIDTPPEAWALECDIVQFVGEHWRDPDEGIWEVRSGRRHFTHSKVMAWVALDRAVAAVERYGEEGPIDTWKRVRREIQEDVFAHGYDDERGYFVRAYDDPELDASLLMLPLVGFIPATDERMRRTIEAIQHDLVEDGLVLRYRTDRSPDGLPPGEGTFLMCSFWLVDTLLLLGRRDEALRMFERLLKLSNDVGLLSEQFDSRRGRLVGNFPQAFSHTALATSALALQTLRTRRARSSL
jgi:GH15 family glucan-1,4-alpha-glucosidase